MQYKMKYLCRNLLVLFCYHTFALAPVFCFFSSHQNLPPKLTYFTQKVKEDSRFPYFSFHSWHFLLTNTELFISHYFHFPIIEICNSHFSFYLLPPLSSRFLGLFPRQNPSHCRLNSASRAAIVLSVFLVRRNRISKLNMFFSGDSSTRKRVDLGGRSSKERDRNNLLEQTRLERNRRMWLRQQNSAALRIQVLLFFASECIWIPLVLNHCENNSNSIV